MLRPPYGSSPEQIEATSWFRQNYASTGPSPAPACTWAARRDRRGRAGLARRRAESATHRMVREDASVAAALVNLAYVDDTCEATLRVPDCAGLFRELDTKNYQPGNLEKPLIKSYREMTPPRARRRGPDEIRQRRHAGDPGGTGAGWST